MARVAVMVHTMALFATWKWSASVSTRKTTTKKSKASRVQPKKLAATACLASEREGGNGLAAVEFENVTLFPSVAEPILPGKCTPRIVLAIKGRGEARGAHCPEVRKDFVSQPVEISTIGD